MTNNTPSGGISYYHWFAWFQIHSGIKQSPYKGMFGVEPSVGLSTTSLPAEIMKGIKDQDDIQKRIEIDSTNEQTN